MHTFQNLDRNDEDDNLIKKSYNKKNLRKRNSEKFFEKKIEIYGRKPKRQGNFDLTLKVVPSKMLEDVEDVMTVFSSASDYNRKTNTIDGGSQRETEIARQRKYIIETQGFYTNYFLRIWMEMKTLISKIENYYKEQGFDLETAEVNNLKLALKRVRDSPYFF